MAALMYLVFPVALLMVLISIYLRLTRPKKHHAVPSPSKLPILGNLHQLGSLPHRSLQALSIKYGSLMLLHLGKIPTIVISSAELAQDILKTNDQVFSSRPFSYAAHHLLFGGNDMAFAPYGSCWRQMRKICILQLLSSKRVQSFKPIREEEVGRMIKEISRVSSMGVLTNLSDMLILLSENIISRVVLGKTSRLGQEDRIGYLAKELEELLGGFYMADYFPSLEWIDVLSGKKGRLKRNFKGWNDFLDQVLDETSRMMSHDDDDDQDKQQHNNFVSVLLQVQGDGGVDSIQLSNDNIKGIVLVLSPPPTSFSAFSKSAF